MWKDQKVEKTVQQHFHVVSALIVWKTIVLNSSHEMLVKAVKTAVVCFHLSVAQALANVFEHRRQIRLPKEGVPAQAIVLMIVNVFVIGVLETDIAQSKKHLPTMPSFFIMSLYFPPLFLHHNCLPFFTYVFSLFETECLDV